MMVPTLIELPNGLMSFIISAHTRTVYCRHVVNVEP